MQIVVVSAALTVFLLFISLFGRLGRKADLSKKRLAAMKGAEQAVGNEELRRPLSERITKPLLNALSSSLRKLLPGNGGKKNSKNREKTQRMLYSAELRITPEEFDLIKLALAVILCGGAYWLMSSVLQLEIFDCLLGAVIGLALGMWAPLFLLKKKVAARNESILHDLPEVMDLLVVSVEAGLGLDAAITRLYEKQKSPLLLELMSTVRDAQMGLPRRESLKAMGDRSDVQELRSFAAAMIQAEQLGVSIKKVLRDQSKQLRLAYRQRCEAKAMKAPVKMLIPMIAFIFPVMFIVLLGPSLPRIAEIF
ncbi:MAG: type II secretion system F family protein [Bacillota bacterium]|nr:type II secretion system F family protein [Bacillota bacterium]